MSIELGNTTRTISWVYAVVRYDSSTSDPHIAFTVKEVDLTLDEAQWMVDRLNTLRGDESNTYFVQATRLVTKGVVSNK